MAEFWEQAFAGRLLADQACSAIAGARWAWDDRPQGDQLPAGVLQVISDDRTQHLKGFDERRESRVQVECWSFDKREAVALREAAIAALAPAGEFYGFGFGRAMFENVRPGGGQGATQFIHREMFDVLVMHD